MRYYNLLDEERTAYGKSIQSTVNKIEKQNKILPFSQITRKWLEVFASNLHAEGKSQNTISIHLRNIRVVYNYAIQGNLISRDLYPFFDYKIKSVKTRKRSLDVESIRKIRDVELTKPWMVRARDLFMLSFYLNGINFKDLSLAKHDQIYQGRLNFNRAKTGRSYSIKIFPEAQEIIDRYQGKKYLLRMIEDKEKRVRKKVRSGAFYKDITDYTNELLKIVAGEAKVPVPLSTYYARHSLASIARNIGISRDDIRAILGHGQDTVTDIYIDLDQERIDEAMRKVLDELKT